MKQFIVLAAILPLLLLFFAQSSLDRLNDRRVELAESAIRAFERDASYDGAEPLAKADRLRARLAQIFEVQDGDVRLDLTPSEDNAQIQYRITVPMGKLMAGGALLGLDEAQNSGVFTFEGEILDVRARTAAIFEEERAKANAAATEQESAESEENGEGAPEPATE